MPPLQLSPTTKDLLFKVRKIVPPLLEGLHKGQHGRVAVVGGCEDYTGAPFFSAHASALLGSDMSHVICDPLAAQVIKTYSPNIMVHPYMRQTQSSHNLASTTAKPEMNKIVSLMDRLHSLVIGPGLGRDSLMQETAREIIGEAKKRGMPIVLDADGLFLVQNHPDVIRGYKSAILTPNIMEFKRLCDALDVKTDAAKSIGEEGLCARLAEALGGVTIIQKGQRDFISNGKNTVICDIQGGLKRSGGQGDTLTGALGTFLAWKIVYQNKLWEHDNSLSDSELMALCAYGAAALTRYCSHAAYEKKGRSLQASDLSGEVGNAFKALFEDDLDSGDAKL